MWYTPIQKTEVDPKTKVDPKKSKTFGGPMLGNSGRRIKNLENKNQR